MMDRAALIAEFEAAPFGPYSPELERMVVHLRSRDRQRQWVIVCLERGKRYHLARLPAGRFDPVEIDETRAFASPAEAEIALFRQRLDAGS